MTRRQVTRTGKGDNQVITRLCNSLKSWSPRESTDAIRDIESGTHSYFVNVDGNEVDVHVVNVNGEKHLRTDPDGKGRNNLADLPDC